MLFLYRPRQTWMPYRLPRSRTQQAAYNRSLQEQFQATHRVATPEPSAVASHDDVIASVKELAALHDAGALSDEEFSAAKAKLFGTDAGQA
jgi:hypothetical protein